MVKYAFVADLNLIYFLHQCVQQFLSL